MQRMLLLQRFSNNLQNQIRTVQVEKTINDHNMYRMWQGGDTWMSKMFFFSRQLDVKAHICKNNKGEDLLRRIVLI